LGFSGEIARKGVPAPSQASTWQAAVVEPKMKQNVGFTALSPAAGQPPLTQGGEGLAWAVTSKSKHPDVAAAYINFLVDQQGMQASADHGNLPALPPADYKPAADSVYAGVLDEWKAVSQKDGLLLYLDYTTPTFYDTLTAGVQELTAGQLTPAKFTDQLQSDYASFQQSK
jgi:raffinose/stachyose/melibiose transport system substrate-binding protein